MSDDPETAPETGAGAATGDQAPAAAGQTGKAKAKAKPQASRESLPWDVAARAPARRGDRESPDAPEKLGRHGSIERGLSVLREAIKTLPQGPGVYRMLDDAGEAVYVGKARNLKRRVTSYTQIERLPARLGRMVAQTARVEIVTTHTEVEALLLESNLIKRLMPRFNVLLRDDKSYPYILITEDHEVPRLVKHRGARSTPGSYYGPFASAGAVNRTITALQRAFMLRNCSDHVYAHRTRPCLQYQIKRCTAPCVGYVTTEQYRQQVEQAKAFLAGKSQAVQQDFARQMEAASANLDFETAALYRDRIRALTQIQQHQGINVSGVTDADAIALYQAGGQTCIQVFFFRGGQNFGNRAYYPSHEEGDASATVLAAFLGQFYDNKPPPPEILVSEEPAEAELLRDALASRAGKKIALKVPKKGDKRWLLKQAQTNAKEALGRKLADRSAQTGLLQGLSRLLDLAETPGRVEVFDNSHVQGSQPVGAMIVATPEGFQKNAYRKFTIGKHSSDGGQAAARDDYAMMAEVVGRRFARAVKEDPDRRKGQWPDLVLVDGGRGQLNAAVAAMAEQGVDDIPVAGIAKGIEREAGREKIFLPEAEPFTLPPNDPVLYFIQRLRDEAHRFAVGAHRQKRGKEVRRNPLDEVPGIGAKRKKALLHHFGSGKAVARAGLADLEAVPGISKAVAKRVYDHFQGG